MKGCLFDVIGYPLPEGLVNEQEVTVTRGVEDMKSVVLDGAGVEFEVFYWQVDVGREFLIGGEHYHESHPTVR
ncbi:hypothetical protein [Luteolibacter soli]|uniref:Uncharacterized protein n=1 Tax=Luteolibacter soli TaxID=3135280 RepID=A0ABU9B207_9BACT